MAPTRHEIQDNPAGNTTDASTSKTHQRSTRKRKAASPALHDSVSEGEGESGRARKKTKARGRPRRERRSPQWDEEGGGDEMTWEPARERGEKKKKHLIDAAYDILNGEFHPSLSTARTEGGCSSVSVYDIR